MLSKMLTEFIEQVKRSPDDDDPGLLCFTLKNKPFTISKKQPIEERILSVFVGALLLGKKCKSPDEALEVAKEIYSQLNYSMFTKMCVLVKFK